MNDEMRLARVDLGPGWIDLGYGEPVVIQQLLKKHFKPAVFPDQAELLHSPYQPPKGMSELTDILEKKYGAPVVVTNGGKQGISATMYALSKVGHKSCAIPTPYWVSIPQLIQDVGLTVEYVGQGDTKSSAIMITTPNNPDGKELTASTLVELETDAKNSKIALIHDAAYYTPIYANDQCSAKFGDAQIYSFSKMYGLSGLRLGYVVVHNPELLPGVLGYVERSTSGVSTASQDIAVAVETWVRDNPQAYATFVSECREAISKSRAELLNLDPQVLSLEPCTSNSMFAWLRVGPKLDNLNARVNILSGDIFGKPGFMRMNIAMNSDLIKTAVDRLNRGSM